MRPFCINQNWREDPQIEGENCFLFFFSFLERFKASSGISLFHVSSSQISLYFTGGGEESEDEKKRATVSFSSSPLPLSPLSGDERSWGVRVL